MSTYFVDQDFEVPKTLETQRFLLLPLHPDLNQLHFEAWTSSRQEVDKVFGPDHPQAAEPCSKDENRKNLAEHFRNFIARTAFSYAILNLEQTRCLGCVYLFSTHSPQYQCQVYFWVRKDEKPKGLEEFVYLSVKEWLQERWPFRFSQIAFPGREISWKDWALSKSE